MHIILGVVVIVVILVLAVITAFHAGKNNYQGIPFIEINGKVNVVNANYYVWGYVKLQPGKFLVDTERQEDRRNTCFHLEKEPSSKKFRVSDGCITYLQGME